MKRELIIQEIRESNGIEDFPVLLAMILQGDVGRYSEEFELFEEAGIGGDTLKQLQIVIAAFEEEIKAEQELE